ncbi:MAG TPA: hypothetical protein VMW03_10050 [Candidatus Krumholzibacteriaceae bacterium]|nr:hypothetical protein [Candidatus Krumholzibacteriaceae bacterium]
MVRAVRKVLSLLHLQYLAPVDVCPTGALTPPELTWPRSLRAAFSDPTVVHPGTGVGGRGTEEIKTNDVTGRLRRGEAGIVVELGRPGTGARLRDVEKMAMALAPLQYGYPGTWVSLKTMSWAPFLLASSIALHVLSMVASLSMKTGLVWATATFSFSNMGSDQLPGCIKRA